MRVCKLCKEELVRKERESNYYFQKRQFCDCWCASNFNVMKRKNKLAEEKRNFHNI